jgi:hypothetical protein
LFLRRVIKIRREDQPVKEIIQDRFVLSPLEGQRIQRKNKCYLQRCTLHSQGLQSLLLSQRYLDSNSDILDLLGQHSIRVLVLEGGSDRQKDEIQFILAHLQCPEALLTLCSQTLGKGADHPPDIHLEACHGG